MRASCTRHRHGTLAPVPVKAIAILLDGEGKKDLQVTSNRAYRNLSNDN